MKEHKEKRHKRSSRDRELSDPPRKIVKREPRSSSESSEDHGRQRRKKQHHSRHHHDYEEALHSSSRLREERGKERDRDRRRDIDYERERRRVPEQFKIKKEPVDNNDTRERAEPSSSRWDEDDDRNRHKNRFRPDSQDGRGRGRGRGRGGFHGNKRPFRSEEEDTSNMEWGKKSDNSGKQSLPPAERDKPNFGLSGKLTEDTNTYKGIVIKYSEPPEARVPKRRWRLYPFKGDEALKVLHVHRASAFLMGRERKVVDIPLDHPSCSKQHAALQFRLVQYTRENGSAGKRIWPYIIDLDSANGTFVNNNKIEPRKYVELLERDVLKFGFSSREYVLLHEHSKDDDEDDDV